MSAFTPSEVGQDFYDKVMAAKSGDEVHTIFRAAFPFHNEEQLQQTFVSFMAELERGKS